MEQHKVTAGVSTPHFRIDTVYYLLSVLANQRVESNQQKPGAGRQLGMRMAKGL